MSDTDDTATPAPEDPHALDPDFTLDPDTVRAVADAMHQAAKHNKDPGLLLAEQLVAVAQLSAPAPSSSSRRRRGSHEESGE